MADLPLSPWYNPTLISPGGRATAEQINAELLKIRAALDQLPAPTAIGIGGGQPNYTWRAYADSADGTANFTTGEPGTRSYLGIATNRVIATPSQFPADYTWQRVQGADAQPVLIEFGPTADGEFHPSYTTGDRFIRLSTDGGTTFSTPAQLTATDLASLDPAAAALLASGGAAARLSVIPNQTVKADYLGAPLPGQLPVSVSPRRFLGSEDVTTTTNWSVFPSGGITATINNDDTSQERGLVSITGLVVASASVRVVSTRNNVDIEQTFYVARQDAAPPTQTGDTTPVNPGAPASDTSFVAIGSSDVLIAISDVLAVQVGSSGAVKADAGLSFSTTRSTDEDQVGVQLQWRYSADGTTWTDAGAPSSDYIPAMNYFSTEPPKGVRQNDGYVVVSTVKTGLTSGATARFQLFGRRAEGIASITGETGSATVVPQ